MKDYSSQYPSSYYSYENRANLTRECFKFIRDQEFQYHLTANFNRKTTYDQGWITLKNWSARVDHKLHGRNFHRKTRDSRLFFLAFPEIGGKSGHLHYHMMAKVPASSEDRFENIAVAEWERLVRSGDLYFQEIGDTPIDVGSVISYGLKEMFKDKGKGLEKFVISTEFAPMH